MPVGVQVAPAVELNKSPFVLGRVNADLTVADARVSRRHAIITQEQGVYYIQDSASANGTLLNGVRLEPDRKAPLTPGAIIGLGPEILFKFEVF
jgi:pSer/pThr/pTyr-binding forkhead associated (FHA) protein